MIQRWRKKKLESVVSVMDFSPIITYEDKIAESVLLWLVLGFLVS
jgi:hypothetical protein